MTEFVQTGLVVLAAYGAAGLLFAFGFQLRGLASTDAAARGAGLAFRLLIMPGVIVLWPLVAMRWISAPRRGSFLGSPDAPIAPLRLRSAHSLAWKALVVLVPIAVALALWYRPQENQGSTLKGPVPEPTNLPGLTPRF